MFAYMHLSEFAGRLSQLLHVHTHMFTLWHPFNSHVSFSLSPQFTSNTGRHLLPFYRGGDERVELKVKLTNWLKVSRSYKEKIL